MYKRQRYTAALASKNAELEAAVGAEKDAAIKAERDVVPVVGLCRLNQVDP